jgi:hypothetical protein
MAATGGIDDLESIGSIAKAVADWADKGVRNRFSASVAGSEIKCDS